MTARLRLAYAHAGAAVYTAYLVREGTRWKLWYTRPLKAQR